MQTIQISAINAQRAYNGAPSQIKEVLKELFAPYDFNQDITAVEPSYENYCRLLGREPLTIANYNFLPEDEQEYAYASHQLDVIVQALNGPGFKFDWSDENQRKWFPILVWDESAAGGPGFSLRNVGYGLSVSFVGARRSFREENLARFAFKHFSAIYIKVHKP